VQQDVHVLRSLGSMPSLFIFGLGFVGSRVANEASREGWSVAGSVRSLEESSAADLDEAIEVVELPFQDATLRSDVEPAKALLSRFSAFLFTAPVASDGQDPFLGDPALGRALVELAEEGRIDWAGYLSTTSVYGDRQGAWVDEDDEPRPTLSRGKKRRDVEQAFLFSGLPAHIFRLPGIYGPGRGTLAKLRKGKATSVIKEGQFFSRIHVDDIVGVVKTSILCPNPGRIYNVVDDLPEMNHIVLEYACELLEMEKPQRKTFEEAKESMSPMARSFYSESKRVRNERIKTELGYKLLFPTYKEGLRAQLDEELAKGWTIIDNSSSAKKSLEEKGYERQKSRSNTPESHFQSLRARNNETHQSKSGTSNGTGRYFYLQWIEYHLLAPFRKWIDFQTWISWFSELVRTSGLLSFIPESWWHGYSFSSTMCLLIDNGSLRPEPFKQLRVHAQNLEQDLKTSGVENVQVLAVSARYSDRIDVDDLDGVPARTLDATLQGISNASKFDGATMPRIVALPYFLAKARTVKDFIPGLLKKYCQGSEGREWVVAEPLVSKDYRLARIVAENVRHVAQERGIESPYRVVLVDHGSPSREVNYARRGIAAQIRRLLGPEATCIVDCSMERRDGDEYSFNDPLLENVFSQGGLDSGDVILAMGFLGPGRHAGEDGDISDIIAQVKRKHTGLSIHQTSLIGDLDRNGGKIVSLLKDRFHHACVKL